MHRIFSSNDRRQTHYNLIANAEQTIFVKNAEKPEFKRTGKYPTAHERWIGFLPLYHAYGQLNTMMMAAKLNIPVYIMSAFVYEDMLQVIQDYKITELQVAPPILVLMSKHPATANYDLSSITKIFSGAAPLSQSLQNECTQRFKTSVGQGWGMTEVTCAGLIAPAGIEDLTGSVGVLLPNSEIKLVDEEGKEVGMGKRGEIYIKGPNVSPGYWKNEKATRETMLEGGWLRSGDVAINDERGWFYIVDRLKVSTVPIIDPQSDIDVFHRNSSKSPASKSLPPSSKLSFSPTQPSPMQAWSASKTHSTHRNTLVPTYFSTRKGPRARKRSKSGSRARLRSTSI